MLLESAEGGVKFTTSRSFVFQNNLSQRNYGRGFWIDEDSTNAKLVHNVSRYNEDRGLQVEISAHVLVASNYVHDNGAYGIYVVESNDVDVFNNTTVRNAPNIYVLEGHRSSGNPDVPHNVGDVRIVNNILWGIASGGDFVLGADDVTNNRSAAAMGVSADGNAYYRTSGSSPGWLVAWNASDGMRTYPTLADFRSGTGNERSGLAVDAASDPFFVDAGSNNFALRAGSPAAGRGLPLPASIAAAIGLPAGVPVNMGALP
jgi:parallel beta-helix repeat protein